MAAINITLTKLNILNNQAVGLNGLGGGTYYHSSTNVIETTVNKTGNSATILGEENSTIKPQ